MLSKTEILEALRGRLIVSVQAYPGEPMRDPNTMGQIAASAVAGGAAAVRVQGLGDIQASRSAVEVPVIGLWKDGKDGVVITPTFQHAYAVALAGSHIVALDGTRRERPDGLSLAETIGRLHEQTNALVMADCGSLDDARAAVEAGADIIGTTLAGYTDERPKTDGPDLDLISEIRDAALPAMLVAEGRIHSPAQAAAARDAGAEAVVVGTAITHPTTITSWFAEAVEG
ncbi:N-acetylmannosamine-6-phosphate 2-epimerase [Brevibacterium spongiae]|uniref:Putative N-acetylmannosamine-6-phosphate 2-epimerase n=1 Tax=Brevibacterium spongiae TaxID=2909672 RepID=A0ABY5SQX4_9MICO|nr:N-acetylmannosamine-6-phosphate 2-epimerase [Brevibacterium spongiae]UVI36715.1 N-acetylmannosamine-6-phosphate 2-epimerase [Brevibacterium spongiae]